MKHILPVALLLCLLSITHAQERRFGWIGDDGAKPARMMALRDWPIQTASRSSDLTKYAMSAYDQGRIGSCVGNGCALAWDMQHFRATGKHLPVSRLMIYYNARVAIDSEAVDSGCQIVDAMASLMKFGSCKETLWPYKERSFTIRPPLPAYTEARGHRVIRKYKVDNTDGKSIRLALTNQWPVVFGAMVYNGIYNVQKRNPVIPMPRNRERPVGGHCMTILGHNDNTRMYLIQNSWGDSWGADGRAWISYDYIHNPRLTEDCWVIEEVMP